MDEANISEGLSREAELYLYQVVRNDSEVPELEERMTFLGCSMESLRSSLTT